MTAHKFLVLLALLFAFAGFASAQVATGASPFGTFGGGPVDTINLANLNVHLSIPVLSKAGRGMSFNYNLGYDTSVWYPVGSSGSQTWQPVQNFGWIAETQGAVGTLNFATTVWCYPPAGCYTVEAGFVYIDWFAVPHPINFAITNTYYVCNGIQGATYPLACPTSDGSGYTFNYNQTGGYWITNTLGASIIPTINGSTGAGDKTDSNGNRISASSSGVFTDTLGQTALTIAGSGTPSSPVTLTYAAPSGNNAAYTIKYTSRTVQTKFNCSGITEYPATSRNLVSEIDLPDYNATSNPNSKYTFTYETTPGDTHNPPYVTGRLVMLTLPSGGAITYSYSGGGTGVNGITCVDGSAATLVRTTPDTGSNAWTYAHTESGTAWTTNITDPQNNLTVMDFQGIYQTEAQVYQGSSTLLQTSYTCYNGSAVPCNTIAVAGPIGQKATYLQWPSGLESEVIVRYDQETCGNGSCSGGLVTEKDEYAYGNGTPGPLMRQTLTTYASLGNGIVGKALQVTVKDASGTIKAQTSYCYDEGTPSGTTTCNATGSPTPTSGTPQHIAISGSRGNATTIAQLVAGSATLGKKFTYYDTGNVYVATDVNGAQTTYSYGPSGCPNSFVTLITEPASNMTQSFTWSCVGGVRTQSTDENGESSQKAYTDNYFWRPSSTTDQNGNVTNYSYTPATSAAPAAAESTLAISANSTQDVLSTLDNLGRGSLQQTRQAPGGASWDSVETDYDSLGRTSRVTLPFTGSAGQTNSSAPATIFSYDSLGRKLSATDAGGGSTSFSYSQNDVLETVGPAPAGENTKRKQLEYDALGRLSSVCEITSAVGSGTCAQTSSQTGYWTRYEYDLLGNVTGVCQNTTQPANVDCVASPSSGQQTRAYTYDGTGRMTSEINPETGATTYTYDVDSVCGTYKGDLVKRIDAVGNTTCYSYDNIHRLGSVTYTGPYAGNTPQKHYVYDSAAVNGTSMTNAKARMAEAYTCTSPCTSKITDIFLGYTPRGEGSDVYETTPHSSGYFRVNQTYWPNGVSAQLSQLAGLPVISYGVDGEGRPNTTLAGSGQNPVTGVNYGTFSLPTQVTFGSGDSDAFGYDPHTARMTSYQFSVNGQSATGALTWNPNSTLQKLAITNPFDASDNQTCTFSYDDLPRIANANCGSIWSQTFTYDAFGNIAKNGTISFQPQYTTSPPTNRYSTIGGSTPSYDANGNVANDFLHTYVWDAENAPVIIDGVGLTYDALGHQVEQSRSGTYTEVVYAPSGEKLALMSGQTLQKAFVPLPGGATAIYTGSGLSCYRHPDWVGSSRLDSTSSRTVSSATAYGPFGETYAPYGSSDPSFTGKNQDTVSNLYDFPAREYSANQGRWPSADPAGLSAADPSSPQSWNRYAYVSNDPLDATDPSGTCTIFIGGVNDNKKDTNGLSLAAEVARGLYVTPYDGQSTLGAILSIAAQDLAGPNASTQAVDDALNSIVNDPNGIQIVAFSGGAQAFSTAVDSGSLGNLASGGPLSSINEVVYLSPGIGPNTDLAFRGSSFTQVYHGSGGVDFAATFFARLSGQAGQHLSGASGHRASNAFLLPASVQNKYTACVKWKPPQFDVIPAPIQTTLYGFGGDDPFGTGCFTYESHTGQNVACSPEDY